MYFPYFRGRQYELLALKELVQKKLICQNVIPVVEPIKISPTLKNTIQAFEKNNQKIAMIYNPAVGDFADSDITELLNMDRATIIPSVLLNESAESTIEALNQKGRDKKEILAVLNSQDYIEDYKSIFEYESPAYVLFPDERPMRRAVQTNKVLFEDKFIKQARNSDYIKCTDEPFSEDHLYYSEEGYTGFGDYSIVGDNYEEGGFSPKAVAIHIVYFADDERLRIKHFVSDSNYDISDVAGKFYEAVIKLSDWYKEGNDKQKTAALETLLDHAEKGYYPGLPTLKKLSIMHHLELVSKYLNRENNE